MTSGISWHACPSAFMRGACHGPRIRNITVARWRKRRKKEMKRFVCDPWGYARMATYWSRCPFYDRYKIKREKRGENKGVRTWMRHQRYPTSASFPSSAPTRPEARHLIVTTRQGFTLVGIRHTARCLYTVDVAFYFDAFAHRQILKPRRGSLRNFKYPLMMYTQPRSS